MADLVLAQQAALIRGLRFDAAEQADGSWVARASSEDLRTGHKTTFEGTGETEDGAYDALVERLAGVPA